MRRLIALSVLAGLAVAGVIVGVLAATDSVSGHPIAGQVADAAPLVQSTELRLAYNRCGSGVLSDADHTMVIDTSPDTLEGSDGDTIQDVGCILTSLSTPESVIAQMEATRALDGMQSATWGDGMAAKWTYHPDNGLDLIITES